MAIITPVGVLASRPKTLFLAGMSKEDQEKGKTSKTFYARILFEHGADLKAVNAAIIEKGREVFGKNFDAMWKEGGIRSPIRKDVATKGYDADRFGCFISLKAWEDNAPVILSNRPGPDKKALPITNQEEMYRGALVRASLRVRAYGGGKTGFSPGISLDMIAVQKTGDAAAMAGGVDTEGLDPLPEEVGGADPALEALLG